MAENAQWVFFRDKVLPTITQYHKANGAMPDASQVAAALKNEPMIANTNGKYKDLDGNPQTPRQRLGAILNGLKSATKTTTTKGDPRPKGNEKAYAVVSKVATAMGFRRGKQSGTIGEVDSDAILAELGL